ncbi:MAG: hypothetical protein Q9168_007136 [Polycauliona sp. 1 TL-2023]
MFTPLIPTMLIALLSLLTTFSLASSPGDPGSILDWFPYGTPGPFPISSDLLATFTLTSQYAAAAYCPTNNNSPNTTLLCPSGNCPLVASANATTVSEFEDTPHFDDTGFIAIDPTNALIVLAIRGSVSKQNWKADFNMLKTSVDWCDDCKIHRGFKDSWGEIKSAVTANMQRAVLAHPDYRIIVTGHSLGGAVATIAAAELRRLDSHFAAAVELYTFGSPRIANEEAAKWLSAQSHYNWRVTNENDVVPRLPIRALGYHHLEPEYWIMRDGQGPKREDVVWSAKEDSSWGNEGEVVPSRSAHHRYFGDISACGPDDGD